MENQFNPIIESQLMAGIKTPGVRHAELVSASNGIPKQVRDDSFDKGSSSVIAFVKKYLVVLLILSLGLNAFLLVRKIDFKRAKTTTTTTTTKAATTTSADQGKTNVFNEINPPSGYEIGAEFGDLGPKLIKLGAIDFEKFKSTYERSGQPLTPEQQQILLTGSGDKVKITGDNSYFLLNFFWAVGLANKSKILDDGDMMKYGGAKEAGNFASTGGWTLAKGNAMNYYSKANLIPLTKSQEEKVDLVASNIYRPCCNNSTAFPDCNHGMALLGVLQLMAANNATEAQMYEASKYFNAFWFPGNYYDIALYLKNKEGKSFKDVDGKFILSKSYSSSSGWQTIKKWLAENGLVEQPPKQGGGCGV